jgi:hypothetical protein
MRVFGRKLGALSAILLGLAQPARCGVVEDIRSDLGQMSPFFNEEVGEALAFAAGSSVLGTGDTLKLLGIELGVSGSGGVSQVETGRFRRLPLAAVDNAGTQLALPENWVVPAAMVHARVGLPAGFDLGARVGGLSFDQEDDGARFEVDNVMVGAEVRKRLLGGGALTGVALPDVALTASYDAATGSLDSKDRYEGPLRGGQTMNADVTGRMDWNVGAVSARVMASKTFLILTPYLGVGYTQHVGETTTRLSTKGTVSSVGSIDESVTKSSDADEAYVSFVAGAELGFLPFLRLNVGVLAADERRAVSAGLKFRFR